MDPRKLDVADKPDLRHPRGASEAERTNCADIPSGGSEDNRNSITLSVSVRSVWHAPGRNWLTERFVL